MNQEKCLITNLKPTDMILDEQANLCNITMVTEPRKAGKHGSAKVFYNYTILYNNNKVQTVGKSRDQVFKISINKNLAEKVFENEEEVTFIDTLSGQVLSFTTPYLINLNLKDKKEITQQFFFFVYKDYCFYQNR